MTTTITINRATVEQALEALESVYGDSCDALHALRAALAQQAEPQPMHPELRKMWEDHFDKCFRAIPVPEQAEPVTDPFNCPKCGRHDYGLHGACPTCDAQQAEPVQEICPGCEATLGAACGRESCPKGWEAAPPRRKPLSEEEIESCRQQGYAHAGLSAPFDFGKAARAVERKVRGEDK